MAQEIWEFVSSACGVLAVGEPAHLEGGHRRVRNEMFAALVARGFRSIALESDRVAGLAVDDFVRGGAGGLDAVMGGGFSHGFGDLVENRGLVAWMREYNEGLPPQERLAFHGFDAPMEMMSAPSPRRYLEHARDYLGLDLDLTSLLGDDERWSRTEALLDAAASPGATPGADRLHALADDMLNTLYTRAPELIATSSRAAWLRAETHLAAGLGLLRYHRQAALHGEAGARWTRMCATRDALMARNLLDIRRVEAPRGATLVFAHNLHLQRSPSHMRMGDMDVDWSGAGAIVAPLLGERYAFVAGSLGRSDALHLADPGADTFEGALRDRVPSWGLVAPAEIPPARTRTDTTPEQGYFPLDRATVDTADAILHISDGATAASGPSR